MFINLWEQTEAERERCQSCDGGRKALERSESYLIETSTDWNRIRMEENFQNWEKSKLEKKIKIWKAKKSKSMQKEIIEKKNPKEYVSKGRKMLAL